MECFDNATSRVFADSGRCQRREKTDTGKEPQVDGLGAAAGLPHSPHFGLVRPFHPRAAIYCGTANGQNANVHKFAVARLVNDAWMAAECIRRG
jgi:hypothetical protein